MFIVVMIVLKSSTYFSYQCSLLLECSQRVLIRRERYRLLDVPNLIAQITRGNCLLFLVLNIQLLVDLVDPPQGDLGVEIKRTEHRRELA